jgi:starvation-inducible DNA-binding protein
MLDRNNNGASAVIDGLQVALSETMVETSKSQNFHWNVTGMAFGPLHALFQEIYEDHFEAQDTIAERMRALDALADGRLSKSVATSSIAESDIQMSDREMVGILAVDQVHLGATLRKVAKAAEMNGDQVTADMAIERADTHEKFAWMLRAHLA